MIKMPAINHPLPPSNNGSPLGIRAGCCGDLWKRVAVAIPKRCTLIGLWYSHTVQEKTTLSQTASPLWSQAGFAWATLAIWDGFIHELARSRCIIVPWSSGHMKLRLRDYRTPSMGTLTLYVSRRSEWVKWRQPFPVWDVKNNALVKTQSRLHEQTEQQWSWGLYLR